MAWGQAAMGMEVSCGENGDYSVCCFGISLWNNLSHQCGRDRQT